MSSKRSMIEAFIRRDVSDAIAELAITSPNSAEWLRANRGFIQAEVTRRVCLPYRMKELRDIVNWKKHPKE